MEHPNQIEAMFQHLGAEIHATAKEKGWYDKGQMEMDLVREAISELPITDSSYYSVIKTIETALKPYDRNDFEMTCLEHAELSEAVEALRKGNPQSEKIPKFTLVEEEMADVIIRMLDRAHKNNYNLGGAILAKMAYNKTREYRHGGKIA